MNQEITIHRALAQLKTTDDRINRMTDMNFITTTVGNSGITDGQPTEQVENTIKSNWDKINKLIDNYQKIKLAIIRSNSGITNDSNVNEIKINDKSMLIAEMLCIHTHIIPIKRRLLQLLCNQYNKVKLAVEKSNQSKSDYLDQLLSKMANSDSSSTDKKLSKEVIESVSKTYKENNCVFLVDPLNLESKIKNLSDEIDEFETSCDAILSEHNALTRITINFDD